VDAFERSALFVSGRDAWISLALGCLTALYNLALLNAVHRLPLAHAILVFYLFPFLATFILAVFGWERLSWQSLMAAAVAFAGLGLVLRLRGSADINVDGLALAFGAALGIAIVIVVSSRVFKEGDSRPLTQYGCGLRVIAGCVVRELGQAAIP
jgi:drug/metabolite transporter (DMT)-like permease